MNSAGIGWAQRTIGKDGKLRLGAQSGLLQESHQRQRLRHVRLRPARRHRDQPYRTLADGERGAIVNISSVAGVEGQIGQVSYSASGCHQRFDRAARARDLSAAGIRVNTIMPGLIDTPIYGPEEHSKEFKANLGKNVLFRAASVSPPNWRRWWSSSSSTRT